MQSRSKLLFFSFLVAQTLRCTHYVTGELPFCSVDLKVLENGRLDQYAVITHYGQKVQSLLEELPAQSGDWFRLNLDADKPGKEIEMHIQQTETGQGPFPAVMINNEVPWGKEMKGSCILESGF